MLKIVKLNAKKRILLEQKRELEEKKSSLFLREQELESALNESDTEEDINIVEGEIEQFEKDKKENETALTDVNKEIEDIEIEISKIENKEPESNGEEESEKEEEREVMAKFRVFKKDVKRSRNNPFAQSYEERNEYLQREEVKEFYERMFEVSKDSSKRGVNNSEIGIPEITMGLIRDSIDDFSAILKYISFRSIKGDAKAIIAGNIPEAVWTECCAKINELEIDFSEMYLYCHKVAGYIPVCNATLEDFDVSGISSLAAEIEYNILKAIGLALDKAIIYGDGVYMPLGFVSSLPMTMNPIKVDETWKDLSETNVKSVSGTATTLFKSIMKAVASSKRHTASGRRVYIMNETTWDTIIAPESLSFNAAGTLVAANSGTFPILGGDILFLSFIPDGDIVGGYLENYILIERKGIKMSMSEHRFFLEDNTVFKATARYDGSPIVPFRDSFFAINVNGKTPATSATFPPDKANEVLEETP